MDSGRESGPCILHAVNDDTRTLLTEYRAALESLYGDRLVKLVLFGSRARGDARPDSDIDVLIVLTGPLDHWAEIQRTSALTSKLSIEHETFLSRLFATPEDMDGERTPFFREVRVESVAV